MKPRVRCCIIALTQLRLCNMHRLLACLARQASKQTTVKKKKKRVLKTQPSGGENCWKQSSVWGQLNCSVGPRWATWHYPTSGTVAPANVCGKLADGSTAPAKLAKPKWKRRRRRRRAHRTRRYTYPCELSEGERQHFLSFFFVPVLGPEGEGAAEQRSRGDTGLTGSEKRLFEVVGNGCLRLSCRKGRRES